MRFVVAKDGLVVLWWGSWWSSGRDQSELLGINERCHGSLTPSGDPALLVVEELRITEKVWQRGTRGGDGLRIGLPARDCAFPHHHHGSVRHGSSGYDRILFRIGLGWLVSVVALLPVPRYVFGPVMVVVQVDIHGSSWCRFNGNPLHASA